MIVLRQTTAEEYRQSNHTQFSWMQRGTLFVLEHADFDYSNRHGFPGVEQDIQFKATAQEVYEWIRTRGIDIHVGSWRNWYAVPRTNIAVEFKLRFG